MYGVKKQRSTFRRQNNTIHKNHILNTTTETMKINSKLAYFLMNISIPFFFYP